MVGDFLPTFANLVETGQEKLSTFYSPAFKANYKHVATPTIIGNASTKWSTAMLVPESIVLAPVYRMTIILIVLGVAVLAVISVVILFISHTITAPMKSMEKVFTVIDGGDFTPALAAESKDEIGNISRSFNNTLGNIRGAFGAIKNKVNALTNTSYELSVNMDKTSKAVDNISSNFEKIKGLEETQKKEAAQVDNALATIQDNINGLKKVVEDQNTSVNTSSSAIEEMTANIHSVSQTLVENSKNVENLMEASELGRSAVQAVAQEIQEIAKDSEGLLEINSVMNKIASQTNLLSMNAAIEAAHAGEVGKGFAVVADEIRKLAESSSQQSKTTSAMLKKIKASIDSITKSSDEVLTRFGAIDTGVKTVSEHELNIRHAMEEQETGGKQILDAIGRLKEVTVSVQKGSEDMSSSGSDLAKETNEFIKLSNEALKGFNEIVNVALKEITVALGHVSEMNAENNKNFEDLKTETTRFKTTTGKEKKKILAVDDDVVQLKVISSFLEDDYDVVGAKSCEAALKLLYQGLDPVYILLDIVMPGDDGWVTYERIKGISDLHNVPIAFLTGSTDPADLERAKKMGAADYIKKPVSKDELLGKVKKALKAT
jgi:methyl-accepting chemotaxis protein